MTPGTLDTSGWGVISTLTTNLWIFAALGIAGAFCLLLSIALIPSLVATRHLPARLQTIRPIFYVLALGAFGGAIFVFMNISSLMGFVYTVLYSRQWI